MEKNRSPMPIPAENSIASHENLLNSGLASSSPSRTRPNGLHISTSAVSSAMQTTMM